MEVQSEKPLFTKGKQLTVIEGQDSHFITVQMTDEDHTLGNALRSVLAGDRRTDFVGYSIPHPAEPKLNLRLQTSGKEPAIEVFKDGLSKLSAVCDHVLQVFDEACDVPPEKPADDDDELMAG